MDPVQFLENLRKYSVELGYFLQNLIYGRLWESESRIVKDGPLAFLVVPHNNGAFSHYLEVGPFSSEFIFTSVPIPFLRADEDLGCPRNVAEVSKNEIVEFTCVIFQVQANGAYPLGINDPPNAIDFYIVHLF